MVCLEWSMQGVHGYLTIVSEVALTSLYNLLGIRIKNHQDITKALIRATAQAFTKMVKKSIGDCEAHN